MSSINNIVKKLHTSSLKESQTADSVLEYLEDELYGVRFSDHYSAAEKIEDLGFRVVNSDEDSITLTHQGCDILIPLLSKGDKFKLDFDNVSSMQESDSSLSVDDMRAELVKYGDFTKDEADNLKGLDVAREWSKLPKHSAVLEDASLSAEEVVWDVLDPAISDALIKITGSGFDDSSYDYKEDRFFCKGLVYFDSEQDRKSKWDKMLEEIRKNLGAAGYEGVTLYDLEKSFVPAGAPFVAYRIYLKARKSELSESADLSSLLDSLEEELYGVKFEDCYAAAESIEDLGYRVVDSNDQSITVVDRGVDITIPLNSVGSKCKLDFDNIEV